MINNRVVILLNLLFIMMIIGCEDTGSVGLDLPGDEDEVTIKTIDTLTVQSSTVFLDTVQTQASGRMLAGDYMDTHLGRVKANSFFRFSLPSSFGISEGAEYDSFTLRLVPNYSYGEADGQQQVTIHRLTEALEPTEDDQPLYNTDSFAFSEQPLAQHTFVPDNNDSLEIAISDQLGKQIFDAARNGDEIVENDYEFQKFLKGLALVGDYETSRAITGFDADSTNDITLRLSYDEIESGVLEEEYVDFPLETSSSFSHISSERPASLQQLTEPNDVVESASTDAQTYMQSGVGLVTRLEFPTLEQFFNIVESDYILIEADLYFFPIANTYTEETPLPSSLQLAVADQQNGVVGYLTNESGSIQTSSPTIDKEFNANTYYHFDVTDFIQNELDTEEHTGYGLLLAPSDDQFSSTVDRLVMGSDSNSEFGMYLQLIVSELK